MPIALYLGALTVGSQLIATSRPNLIAALFGSPLAGQASGFLLVTVPVSLYFALQEAAPAQATWGKGRCRLKVVGAGGRQLSFSRALARTALKFLPWELAHACIWQARFAPAELPPPIAAGFVLVWVLVGGGGARDIHARKGLKRSQQILDHMGSAELAANPFRATQTEQKLKREQITGKERANQTHDEVGRVVRATNRQRSRAVRCTVARCIASRPRSAARRAASDRGTCAPAPH